MNKFIKIAVKDLPRYLGDHKEPTRDKTVVSRWIKLVRAQIKSFPDEDARTWLTEYLDGPVWLNAADRQPVFAASCWLDLNALYGTDVDLVPVLPYSSEKMLALYQDFSQHTGEPCTIGSSIPSMGTKYGIELPLHWYDPKIGYGALKSKARNEIRKALSAQDGMEIRNTIPPDVAENNFYYWGENDGYPAYMVLLWLWIQAISEFRETPVATSYKDGKWYACAAFTQTGDNYQFTSYAQHSDRRTSYSGLFLLNELVQHVNRPVILTSPSFSNLGMDYENYKKHLCNAKTATHSLFAAPTDEDAVPPYYNSTTREWSYV